MRGSKTRGSWCLPATATFLWPAPSTETVTQAAPPPEAVGVVCGTSKGVKMLAKQGPDAGASSYLWHCKGVSANALMRSGPGARLGGHFVLAGPGMAALFPGSGGGEAGAAEPALGPLSRALGPTVGQAAVLQRLEGEAAALQQWLRLVKTGEACSELGEREVAEKRVRSF